MNKIVAPHNSKNKRCKICKILISNRSTYCKRHAMIGKRHPNYIHGNTSRKYFCKDCNNPITVSGGTGEGRCIKCANIKKSQDGNIGVHGTHTVYKGIHLKSGWEEAFCKWCDKNHIKWQYEPRTFNLGNTTYTPDFYIPVYASYIEIKGWWRDDAKKKYNRFRRIFPKEDIMILDGKKLKKLGVLYGR